MLPVQRSVTIEATLVEAAEREGREMNRATAAQIEHWIRLGMAFESSPGVSKVKIRQALAGETTIDDLNALETRAFFANLAASMQTPTQAERDFYASLGGSSEAPGLTEEELYGNALPSPDGKGKSAGE